MEFYSLFLAGFSGLIAGATVAIPFGPMGQLAARLVTENRRRDARQMALACLAADSTMAAVVLFGLAWLPKVSVHDYPFALAFIGVVLACLGLELWRSAPHAQPGHLPGGFKRPWRCAAIYSTLHPGALLAFTAAFGALHVKGVFAYGLPDKIACWFGVAFGVAGMWTLWLMVVHRLKRHIQPSTLRLLFARGLAFTLTLGGLALVSESGVLGMIAMKVVG